MISQIFFLSARGDTIINRDFRSDLIKNTPQLFYRSVKLCPGDKPPIFNIEGINFAYLKKASIFIVATTRFNVSPAYLLELLNRIMVIIKDFCGVINEESIRKNFVLVYQILDEIIDFGHAQLTNSSQIKPLIASDVKQDKSSLLDLRKIGNFSLFAGSTVPSSASSAPLGKAADNSIYVDVFEKINVLVNSSGYSINSSIDGSVQMKSYLNTNAALKLAFNKNVKMADSKLPGSVVLDDCNYHDAVDHDDFSVNRVLKITPPQGQFVLMNYRITTEFSHPFRVTAFFQEQNPYKLVLTLKVVSTYPKENVATMLSVRFGVPRKVSGISNEMVKNTGNQVVNYSESAGVVEWNIAKMSGQTECTLLTRITLAQASCQQAKREVGPVSLTFEICMYSISGLQIASLDDTRSSADPLNKYIRYVTKSSSYVCRIS